MNPSDTPTSACYGPALSADFFDRDPREVAPDLLGAVIVSTAGGRTTAGTIVETEAYLGSDDPGSHAATRGMTARNAVMYGPPGRAYVYFTYGNHHMLNLVCEPEGTAGGVLLRALEPREGLDVMAGRRRGLPVTHLCDGPGKLAAALGVTLADNAVALGCGALQVYAGARPVPAGEIVVTGRVGLRHGHELPYRYLMRDCPFVSKGRTGPIR